MSTRLTEKRIEELKKHLLKLERITGVRLSKTVIDEENKFDCPISNFRPIKAVVDGQEYCYDNTYRTNWLELHTLGYRFYHYWHVCYGKPHKLEIYLGNWEASEWFDNLNEDDQEKLNRIIASWIKGRKK